MKLLLSLLLAGFISQSLYGAACCGGEGPKSFLQLRELQSYQLGISTSLKDIYGRYDEYGDLIRTDKSQTYTLSAGAAAKVTEDLDAQLLVPWVYQVKEYTGNPNSAGNLGDISVGARYALVRAFFHDDWYPSIFVSGGLKFPTGTVEALSNEGKITPGSGNGIWEPYLGVFLQKNVGFATLGLSATYTGRFKRTVDTVQGPQSVKEGDRVTLGESGTIPLSERWSLTLGSNQTWDMARQLNGSAVADSAARFVTGVVSTTYFLTRYWAMSVEGEAALPIAKLGVNQQAARTITMTTSYAFY